MSEFNRRPLCELADCRMGETILSKDLDGTGYPIFSADSSAGAWGHKKQISKILKRGSIVIGARGTIGNPRLPDHDQFGCTQTTIAVTPSSEVDPYYLKLALESSDIKSIAAQQAVPMLTIGQIVQLEIAVPPLPEQRKIAEILSGIDKALERIQRRTNSLQGLEMAMRNEFFDNLTLESHPEKKLSELVLAPITYGIVQPGNYDPNGIILVRGQDYLQGWGKTEFFKVAPELSNKYKRSLIQAKDVLICIAGANTGDSSITPGWISNANITQTTARIRANPSIISPEFLLEFTKSRTGRERLMNYVRGSAQPGLNLSDIEKILIPVPESNRQKKIAESLHSLKKSISHSLKKENYLKQVKSGLSSDLLSGRKRVSV
jgi:type I restriction enzyme S subunit